MAEPHIHVHQDEIYEVRSGRLTYLLDGKKSVAEVGSVVTLPRNVSHQHYSEGPEDAVVIQTMRPGLDFDYLLENIFGLGSEGRGITGIDYRVQGLVWIRRMKSIVLIASVPRWLQFALARVSYPIARLFGYRAVYRRFSGEDW